MAEVQPSTRQEFRETSADDARYLVDMILDDQEEIVEGILDDKFDPNTKTPKGARALMVAIGNKKVHFVKMLLKHGADPETTEVHEHPVGSQTITALMYASEKYDTELVDTLIDAGADVNRKLNAWTALMRAARIGVHPTIRKLIDRGADPNLRGVKRRTALMIASSFGQLNAAKALIESGADFDLYDNDGKSALDLAIDAEKHSVVRFLQEQN